MITELSRQHIPFGGEAIGVIPARCASTRFPDKPLALINGIPMVCWTLKRASCAISLRDVFVAAEDQQIIEAVQAWGGKAKLVKGNFRSGSDRVFEAVRESEAPAVVNIQADEPLLNPVTIDESLQLLEKHPEFGITTLYRPLSSMEEYLDPNCVKVVLNRKNRCLYFSRSPIPARYRQQSGSGFVPGAPFYQHIGIYCFRRSALEQFAKLPASSLEENEGLEQLRFLESGGAIGAVEVKDIGPSINTQEDLNLAEKYIKDLEIAFS